MDLTLVIRSAGEAIGLMAEYDRGPVTWHLLAKVGLGNMQQKVDIVGQTVIDVPGDPVDIRDAGLLAQPTNIGSYSQSVFSVSPEIGIKMAYHLNDCIDLTAGYSFVFWNKVALAADQVDLGINTPSWTASDRTSASRFCFPADRLLRRTDSTSDCSGSIDPAPSRASGPGRLQETTNPARHKTSRDSRRRGMSLSGTRSINGVHPRRRESPNNFIGVAAKSSSSSCIPVRRSTAERSGLPSKPISTRTESILVATERPVLAPRLPQGYRTGSPSLTLLERPASSLRGIAPSVATSV